MEELKTVAGMVGRYLRVASNRAWVFAGIAIVGGAIGDSLTAGVFVALPMMLVSLICEAIEKQRPPLIIYAASSEARNERG